MNNTKYIINNHGKCSFRNQQIINQSKIFKEM